MIHITKVNELKVKIDCERDIAKNISEMFTFYAKDYKTHPLYLRGLWDGKIRLFELKTHLLPIGLLANLIRECKKHQWHITIDPALRLNDHDNDIDSFVNNELSKLVYFPFEYQTKSFIRSIKLNRALVLSPTGSGKSLIIYLLVRFFMSKLNKKILISVPSTNLVKQMHSDFCSYEYDRLVCDECYEMSAGESKLTSRKIVISTWQMLYRQPKEFFDQFDMLIVDEAHQANTKALGAIIQNMPEVIYRFGFTGTLDGSKTHEMQCRAWFGSIVHTLSTKELMDDGVLSDLTIVSHSLNYTKEDRALCNEYDYHQEINFITEHKQRNDYIIKLANQQSNNTLVLFNFIKHGEALYEQALKNKNKKVFFISGSVDAKTRERIRETMEKENNIILIASFGTLSVGFNLKNLHTIIFAHPYKAQIRTLQSIGRGLRKAAGKEKAILVDIVDDLQYNRHINFAYRHAEERLRIYKAQKFNISFSSSNL